MASERATSSARVSCEGSTVGPIPASNAAPASGAATAPSPTPPPAAGGPASGAGELGVRVSELAATSSSAVAAAAPESRVEAARIDGKGIAKDLRAELKTAVDALVTRYSKAPGLAVLLVGEREDSAMYVRMKRHACDEVGITSIQRTLPGDVAQADVVATVRGLNADPAVHGILVQLPLPEHIDEAAVLDEVSVNKDVDGLSPVNVGLLALRGRTPTFVACTPAGCIELLDRSGVEIEGKRAVVLGRSNIVGVPVAALLQRRNATVTVCHSRTVDVASIVRQADIVVAAIGVTNFVRGDWLKPGCVVIDVGINNVPDATKKSGCRLVGDVCFDEAKYVASMITPVPGGVGPMTIAMLLSNTVKSATAAFDAEGTTTGGAPKGGDVREGTAPAKATAE